MTIITSFKSLNLGIKVTICLSLILLLISLTQPAFYIDRKDNPAAWADSWLLFFFGWTFPLGGAFIPFLFWCANPIYVISIFLTISGKRAGFYLSLIATIIAFSFSQLDTIMASKSGSKSKIQSLELGYILWLISFIIMSLGVGINLYLKTQEKN